MTTIETLHIFQAVYLGMGKRPVNMYDSTFTNFSIEWERVEFGTTEANAGCRQRDKPFGIQKRVSWGKSVSVDHLKVSTAGPGEQRLEVEMQRGDQIIVVGREVLEKLAD